MANVKKKTTAKTKKAVKPAAKKTTAVKKTAAKKTAAKKPLVKKAKAVKTAVKKVPAKKAPAKKAVAKKTAIKTATKPDGIPEQLLDATLKVLDERQAEEIIVVPLAGRSSLADYVVIASGRASRQIAAIADHLQEAFYKNGVRNVRVEGKAEANWVLVDAGDIVIHLFRPEVRKYYDLDGIWKPEKSR